MDQDDTGRRHVAVGQTHAAAVRAFGELFEDLVVTAYDELPDPVLDGAATVALAAGPGQDELLDQLLGGPAALLVQAGPTSGERSALARVLAAHGAGVVGVRHAAAGAVLLVGPAGAGVVTGDALAVVLDAAGSAGVGDPAWPAVTPPRTDARAVEPVKPPAKVASASVEAPINRRVRLRTAAVAVVAALGLAGVLTGIGLTDLGSDGVVVALLALLGAGQVLLVRGIRAVRREVEDERALAHRFRVRVNQRFDKVIKHGLGARQGRINHGKRLVRLEEAAAKQAAHQEYVVELGRILTRRLDDLADR